MSIVPSNLTVTVRDIAAVTGGEDRAVLIVEPSACVISIDGIVMVASVPVMLNRPASLFAIRTPIAPAFCAFLTFAGNEQLPRSIRTILPFTSLTIASQASVTVPVPSFASSSVPETSKV